MNIWKMQCLGIEIRVRCKRKQNMSREIAAKKLSTQLNSLKKIAQSKINLRQIEFKCIYVCAH